MSPVANLEASIRKQYDQIGLDKYGQFIGRKRFKEKMFLAYPSRKAEIRQIVNKIVREGMPSPNPSSLGNNTASSNSILSQQQNGPSTVVAKVIETKQELRSNTSKLAKVSQEKKRPQTLANLQRPITEKAHDRSSIPREVKQAVEVSKVKGGAPNGSNQHQEPLRSITVNPKILELQRFIERSKSHAGNDSIDPSSTLIMQLGLLGFNDEAKPVEKTNPTSSVIENAVLFSTNLLERQDPSLLPQYGLLGILNPDTRMDFDDARDSRIYLNTNIPFSAFICGVQGSGKSHTVSCLIESCIIQSPILGVLPKPLSALVFHFEECNSRLSFRPSEAAFLAFPRVQFGNPIKTRVQVLVSPSNYLNLSALYEQIPGVTVRPFKLRSGDLNVGIMLTLMAVDRTESAPLYISQVTRILREMASQSSRFDYLTFRSRLDEASLDRKQMEFLKQRLDLLESFLDLDGCNTSLEFEPGSVTIIDMSCPFVDSNTACVMFKIGMDMYLESGSDVGKIVAVDEAHKYITDTSAAKALTESLLTVIRQQRHYGARLIISTQEPTISPRLIDLCSMTIIHRFSSPQWFRVLSQHISMVDDEGSIDLFKRIFGLKTGEALVFAPSAVVVPKGTDVDDLKLENLIQGLLKVKVRKRVTWDGGKSIVCL